jgi:hypothetical protein
MLWPLTTAVAISMRRASAAVRFWVSMPD